MKKNTIIDPLKRGFMKFKQNLYRKTNKKSLYVIFLFVITCVQNTYTNAQTIQKYLGSYGGFAGSYGLGHVVAQAYASSPCGIVFDAANNMYYADAGNNQIRRVDAVTGMVSLVAGVISGTGGYTGDGAPATSYELNSPQGLAIDASGNLYVADHNNNRIRKITNPGTSPSVSTIAGDGTSAHTGDGGLATSAEVLAPISVAVDPFGNVYLSSDYYSDDACIRVIGGPTSVTPLPGYIAMFAGTQGVQGDLDGAALSAQIGNAQDLKSDALGNIFFSDAYNGEVKKVTTSGNVVTIATLGGSFLAYTGGLAFDGAGNVYVTDWENQVIDKISNSGVISTFAGNGTSSLVMCNPPLSTGIGTPQYITFDLYGNLFISDNTYNRIMMLSNGTHISNVDVNTVCAPLCSSPAVNPTFTVTASGGIPPYAYNWTAWPTNYATIDDPTSRTPQVSSIAYTLLGGNIFYYQLGVSDYPSVTVFSTSLSCQTTDSRMVETAFNCNPTYDLAMRDSYYDMYVERNNQNVITGQLQVWESPDLWNRVYADGVHTDLPACYGCGNNHIYTTVRNIGCRPYNGAGANLKLYWASAGHEAWNGDWTGINSMTSTGATGCPSSVPTGGNIATVPINMTIPIGGQQPLNASWAPANPTCYTGSDPMDMCYLARIEDPSDIMTFPETTSVSDNVWNNNNIVSRNSSNVNLLDYPTLRIAHFIVGNSEVTNQTYSIQFINDHSLFPSSTPSTLNQFITVTVALGNTVFSSWVQGGALGTYASVDYQNQTVTFDGTNTMQLDNIAFNAGESDLITLSFAMNNNVNGTQMQNEKVHFRELYTDPITNNVSIYANYTYLVTYDAAQNISQNGQDAGSGGGNTPQNKLTGIKNNPAANTVNGIKVYPNPATTTLYFEFPLSSDVSIKLMDITGRVLQNQYLQNVTKTSFDVKGFVPGMYIYEVNNDGKVQTGKITISE